MATRILVPLDGSDLAEQALPCAVMLARGMAAELVLLRAISLQTDVKEIMAGADLKADAALAQLEARADDYLRKVAGQLEEADLHAHRVVRQGPAAGEIVDYAEGEDIGQIVMATHGYSGISRWRHGSVSERVLQSASVPVLLVRAGEKKTGDILQAMRCQRIMVPLDGSPIAEQVLPPAISVARALDAEIVLFRVPIAHMYGAPAADWHVPLEGTFETANQIAEEYLNRVADELRAQGVRVTTCIRMGGVASVIIEYAEANEIELIAMCTHGRTGLARWALGSVADRVLRAGHIPLLLVRAR